MVNLRAWYLPLFALLITQAIYAQQANPASDSAPVPPAIAGAKRVFISNAGEDNPIVGMLPRSKLFSGGQDRCYSEFYRGIQALNRYELVPGPADAEVVFEINLTAWPVQELGRDAAVLRLNVLDPKTRIILWAFYERLPQRANLKRNEDKDLSDAIERIVSDLKSIIGPAPSMAKP